MEKPQVSTLTKIRAVVCPMMINLAIGSYYAYSNINPYVASHLGVKSEDTIVVMQIWLLFQSLFAIVGVKLSERFGYWAVNYVAFVGFALLNLVVSLISNYIIFILCYGCLSGMFIGLGYLPSLYTAWTYFPEKKSAVTGSILFCAGMSASFLSPISTLIVNPNNMKKDDPNYGENVPKLFQFYSVYFGVIALVACSLQPQPLNTEAYKETKHYKELIRKNTTDKTEINNANRELKRMNSVNFGNEMIDEEDIKMVYKNELADQIGQMGGEEHAFLNANLDMDRITDLIMQNMKFHNIVKNEAAEPVTASIKSDMPFNSTRKLSRLIENNAEALYKKSKELQEQNCPSQKYAIRSGPFFMIASMAICCSIYPYFLNSNWKAFYQDNLQDITDSKMSFILSFGAVANSSIRIIVGFLLLKVDVKMIFYFITLLSIFGAFTIQGLLKTYEWGVLYIMFAYMGLGTQVTLFPTICTKVFGSTVGPKVYPLIYLCFSISNFSQYFLYKFLGKENMTIMFYSFGSLAFLGVVIGIMFNAKPSWTNAIYHFSIEQEKKVRDTVTEYSEDKKEALLNK